MFLTQSGSLSYVIKRPDVWNNDRLVTGAKWTRVFRSPYDTRSCSFRNPQKSFSRGRGCWRMGLMLDLITVVIKLSGSHKSVPGRVCRNLVGVFFSLSLSLCVRSSTLSGQTSTCALQVHAFKRLYN